MLAEQCSQLIKDNWDKFSHQDFESLSGELVYQLLKSKATDLQRESDQKTSTIDSLKEKLEAALKSLTELGAERDNLAGKLIRARQSEGLRRTLTKAVTASMKVEEQLKKQAAGNYSKLSEMSERDVSTISEAIEVEQSSSYPSSSSEKSGDLERQASHSKRELKTAMDNNNEEEKESTGRDLKRRKITKVPGYFKKGELYRFKCEFCSLRFPSSNSMTDHVHEEHKKFLHVRRRLFKGNDNQ